MLVIFRILSSILLTANLHMLSLSFFLLSFFKFSYSSLLIVSVQKVAFSGLFRISSFSLITHSLFLAFLHSMHFPHLAGTKSKRLSSQIGALKLFFRFGWYFLFVIYFVYRHIFLFFSFSKSVPFVEYCTDYSC